MSVIHPQSAQFLGEPGEAPRGSYWTVGRKLKIGKIYTHSGEDVDFLVLEPQGIAHLVSKERLELPQDVCAFAHVVTGLCNKGLLTLNIGVIDPGWSNHVSSSILNFSSEPRLLTVDEEFIRVSFLNIRGERPPADASRPNESSSKYCSEVRSRAVHQFGEHFLNLPKLVEEAAERETTRLRDAALKFIPLGAFSLAFFALMVTVGIPVGVNYFLENGRKEASLDERLLESEMAARQRAEAAAEELRARVDALEKAMQSQNLQQPPGSVPPSAEVKR
jgi:hypothetical protein